MRLARLTTCLALVASACTLLAPSPAIAAPRTTDPAVIKALAADAYVWGLGPEYIERFSTYNTIIGAPFNELKYGSAPAAWNNEATNAGNASVLYVSGFTNFDEAPALVLTVPPSRDQYYVVAYYDAYGNTIGSIGTRTTPTDDATSYLLVGPDSPYARTPIATIRGHDYPVMASDTDINWFLIRVATNTLVDAADPTSVPNVTTDVVQQLALNSLTEFQRNGHQPVYPPSFVLPPPTPQQIDAAAPFQNAPTEATEFFAQLGAAVVANPIPRRDTGLSGTALADLPPWMVPQYGARRRYTVPSAGQQSTLASFAPIGLTRRGFRVPRDWGSQQLQALQDGFELGRAKLDAFIASGASDDSNNGWTVLNDLVGTYPNNQLGYLYRSLIVVAGGVANVALDAVYPTLAGSPEPFDGDQTYKLTFDPPTADPTLPADGTLPPMVTGSDGHSEGFWSVHVYATDPTQGAAPFIAQTSVLNTSYSEADTPVVSVEPEADTVTVPAPDWGILRASTPILFDEGAAATYGLRSNTVYYVAGDPEPTTDGTAFTFQVSEQWLQPVSDGGVPIQGPGGVPGAVTDLVAPADAAPLRYGMVKPVTQLGSPQLDAGQLAVDADGSVTLWFGPSLPAGAPVSNWIPTPSTAYYGGLYPGRQISTAFQLTLRMYYPTPGNEPPSILPCTTACRRRLQTSYIPPALELVDPAAP